MHASVKQLFKFIDSTDCPKHNKTEFINKLKERFNLTTDRKIYYNNHFAVRVSFSKNGRFGNTVLSLSALQKYDSIPVFVILISSDISINPKIMMINSTFLKKISQSSHELRIDNIKGSFNGSDILRQYQNINNTDNQFSNAEKLFAYHLRFTWQENLERLVNETNNICATKEKLTISNNMRQVIYKSIINAQNFINSKNFIKLNKDLKNRLQKCKDAILIASRIENINIRGRLIEVLITSSDEKRNQLLQ